jgi:hypothetical protein
MNNFRLNLRLRLRYLIYSIATVAVYSIIGSALGQETGGYIPGIGFFDFSISQVIAGVVVLYLQTSGVEVAMKFYTTNKVGALRAYRWLFGHRDVITINVSWKNHWESAKTFGLFGHVIPANLFGLGALLGIQTFFNQGIGFLFCFYVAGCVLLGMLSSLYAWEGLCDAEVTELHERPQSYDHAFTRAKLEQREEALRKQMEQLQEKERRRNAPAVPPSEKQKRTPPKPY